ncbi:MAG: helix-turn-helix transcriptional regulator [Pseudooceanicola sp.]|nr:helix-turn-helix transcriptional regulator [Pseudooceanicola sp.]
MHPLTRYRRDNGISQRDFAQMVGVDQSVVSRIEARSVSPSLNLAIRIQVMTSGKVTASDLDCAARAA